MKRLIQTASLFALTLLFPLLSHAQAGVFARMGFGARGVAMGGALVADGSGAASPYYNPALAPFIERQHLEAAAALLSQGRELQFLQIAAPLRPNAGIAGGLIHAGVSGIDGRDASGYHTGELQTDEFAFFLAFGTRLGERLTGGLGLQVFRADLYEGLRAGLSIGIDAGLTFQATDRFRLALALDDALARYTWDTSRIYGENGKSTTDRFPTRLRLGGAYELGGTLIAAEAEARISPGDERQRETTFLGGVPRETTTEQTYRLLGNRFRVGVEHRFAQPLALRAGVDGLGADGFAAGIRPSAGFMLEREVAPVLVRGEYAFVLEPYGAGGMHLVSLKLFL